jgi:hypothetical protein
MRRILVAIGLAVSCAGLVRADSGEIRKDRVILADRSVRTGRVVWLDATDLALQEDGREASRYIPLAEVREIRWEGGGSRLFRPVENPDPDEPAGPVVPLRSSPHIRPEDLVLTHREVIANAIPRAILVGTAATFFASGGDGKKAAFAAGFVVQMGVSISLGW